MSATASRVTVAFAALYVFWGSTYLGSKFAMASFPPALLSGIRFTIGGLAMAALMAATGSFRVADFAQARWWRNGALAGALLFAAANVMVSSGVQRIPSGVAALIVSVTSVWIVLFDRLILRAGAPSWTILLGLACGLGGVAILGAGDPGAAAGLDATGVLFAAGSTVAWAAGTMDRRGRLPRCRARAEIGRRGSRTRRAPPAVFPRRRPPSRSTPGRPSAETRQPAR